MYESAERRAPPLYLRPKATVTEPGGEWETKADRQRERERQGGRERERQGNREEKGRDNSLVSCLMKCHFN